MTRTLLIISFLTWSILVSAAYGHHSFAATYIVDKEIRVDGKLAEFMFRNPHSFVKVEAPDDSGKVQTWTVEWGGGARIEPGWSFQRYAESWRSCNRQRKSRTRRRRTQD